LKDEARLVRQQLRGIYPVAGARLANAGADRLAAVAIAAAASHHEANLKRGRRYVTYGLVVARAEMPRSLVLAEFIPAATVAVVIVMSLMFSATGFRRGCEQSKCANDGRHRKCE
jgi:hypothetical protein